MSPMEKLFSVFDPTDFLGLSMNWVSCLIFFIVPSSFWACQSPTTLFISKMFTSLFKEFKHLMGGTYYTGSIILFSSIFGFILTNNFFGLFPYIFTDSSHLSFSLSLSLPLWLGLIVFMYFFMVKKSLSMLVPKGSPMLLSPMMVLVEILSNIIRPITLAVRLSANIMAGHLLIVLISLPCSNSSLSMLIMVLCGLLLLMVLESAVACIQAYVFSVLSCLYYSESSGEMSKMI